MPRSEVVNALSGADRVSMTLHVSRELVEAAENLPQRQRRNLLIWQAAEERRAAQRRDVGVERALTLAAETLNRARPEAAAAVDRIAAVVKAGRTGAMTGGEMFDALADEAREWTRIGQALDTVEVGQNEALEYAAMDPADIEASLAKRFANYDADHVLTREVLDRR